MQAGFVEHAAQSRLRLLPVLFAADVFVAGRIAERKLHAVILEADRLQHEQHKVERDAELVLDLLGRAEEMGVVLSEAADAEHAVEFARLLVAIDGAELGEPHRQVAVTPRLRFVNLNVVRAVHRLEQVPLLGVLPAMEDLDLRLRVGSRLIAVEVGTEHSGRGEEFLFFLRFESAGDQPAIPRVDQLARVVAEHGHELRVAIVREVAARLVHLDAADVRRIDGLIAAVQELALDEVFENRADCRPFRQPEAEPLPDVVGDGKEAELFAEHAVVAAFGLFDLLQVGFEFVLLEERGAVEPLQLGVVGVPLPVRAGDREELERLDAAGVGNVRSAAEVDELSLPIKADGRMLGQARVDVFDLEFLMQAVAEIAGLLAVEDKPLEWLGVLDDFFHLVFDAGEIVLAEFMRAVEIVVIAVRERRAEGEVHVWEKSHHRAGHHVGTRMPQHAECFGIAIGQQPQFDGLFGVSDFFERPGRSRRCCRWPWPPGLPGRAAADAFGDVEAGAVVGEFLERTVGQTNGDHAKCHSIGFGATRSAVTKGEPFGSGEFRYIVQRPFERQRCEGEVWPLALRGVNCVEFAASRRSAFR